MTAGIVRIGESPRALEIQVEGRGTMLHSQAIRQWAEVRVLSIARVRVDLSRCTHMDSTFVGTLLCLKRLSESRPGGGLVLVGPSVQCLQVLEQMRIGRIFTVDPECPVGCDWQEVQIDPCAAKTLAFKSTVVEAHQHLADCPGPAGDRFRQLADDMARELARETAGKTAQPGERGSA